MNMRELTRRARVTERQVRYLIAEGFIPAPRGGRANADYGDDHVAAIRRYARLPRSSCCSTHARAPRSWSRPASRWWSIQTCSAAERARVR
jgi:hypothetical protein